MNYFATGFFPLGYFATGFFPTYGGVPVIVRDPDWAVTNAFFGWTIVLVGNPWKAELKQSPWKVTNENF